jgi:cell division septation protein DedD
MSDPEPVPPATQPGALEPATTDPAPIPGSDSGAGVGLVSATSASQAALSGAGSETPDAAAITPADSPASGPEPSSDEEPGIPTDSVDPDPESNTGAISAEPVGAQTPVDAESAYVVHLGSFRLRREADGEVARLQGLGYDARALHVNVPGKGPWYRVVIGAFATFAEARQSALVLGDATGRTRPNVVGAGGYGAPVPVLEESESPGTATP